VGRALSSKQRKQATPTLPQIYAVASNLLGKLQPRVICWCHTHGTSGSTLHCSAATYLDSLRSKHYLKSNSLEWKTQARPSNRVCFSTDTNSMCHASSVYRASQCLLSQAREPQPLTSAASWSMRSLRSNFATC
jgi:hypothetical protein